MRLNILVSAICALFLSACSSASFFVANLPLAFTDFKRHADIAYGDQTGQRLDIYTPATIAEPAPVVIFFHGGRWTFGNKEQYAFAALPFLKKGYIVVIPDYAKYPDVKFPAFVQDAARAVSWTYDHIAAYKGDSSRLYLSGHSSGAHLAALVSTDPAYLHVLGKDRDIITAFAGLAGPYAFTPDAPDLVDMFGPSENYPLMQVTSFIDGKQPPMLLLHGSEDTDVKTMNATRVRDEIKNKGGVVEVKIYPDIDHKEIMGALSWVWDKKAPVLKDMTVFFERHK